MKKKAEKKPSAKPTKNQRDLGERVDDGVIQSFSDEAASRQPAPDKAPAPVEES